MQRLVSGGLQVKIFTHVSQNKVKVSVIVNIYSSDGLPPAVGDLRGSFLFLRNDLCQMKISGDTSIHRQ